MSYRLLIFEDNTKLRQSLETLLNDEKNFSVVGSFDNCDDAVGCIDMLKAELVIMDIDMPGIGSIKGVKQISSIHLI